MPYGSRYSIELFMLAVVRKPYLMHITGGGGKQTAAGDVRYESRECWDGDAAGSMWHLTRGPTGAALLGTSR